MLLSIKVHSVFTHIVVIPTARGCALESHIDGWMDATEQACQFILCGYVAAEAFHKLVCKKTQDEVK